MKEPVTYTIETDFNWAARRVTFRIVPSRDLDKHETEQLLRELRAVLNHSSLSRENGDSQ